MNDEREQARRRERYVHLEAIRARAREMGEAAHRMQEVAEARQARIVAAAKRQRR